jgi:hypothetical protein
LESGSLMDFGQHPCTKQRRKGVIWQDQQMNDEQYEHWVSQLRRYKGGSRITGISRTGSKRPQCFSTPFPSSRRSRHNF